MYMHFCKFIIVFLCFVGVADANEAKNLEVLHINNSKKELIKFDVEVADTFEEHKKGLMFRTKLPKNEGMLFVFEAPKELRMWMKNTYIPLDILFIDQNGVIKKIVQNTTPHSLKTISSDTSVIAALEINAMMSEKNFIEVGDVVLHPFFNKIEDLNVIKKNTR